MDFELDDDERALQEGIRSFLSGRFPMEVIREQESAGGAVDPAGWQELAGVGVFSLRRDGFGATEAALAYQELGAALVGGPLVAQHLAAALTGPLGDTAATGTRIVGLVQESEPVTVVEHLASLDDLLVLRDSGVRRIDPAELRDRTTPAERPLDALTPVWTVVGPLPEGEPVADAATAAEWLVDGRILTAALQLGICLATVELARSYAMEREQFGRPIGSFQAVKHLLADMLTRAEVARAAVYAAAVTRDGEGDGADPTRMALAAKILAGDAALFCGKTCIQVHGGMGFTWEVDAQRYWKRACVLDTHHSNADVLAEAYAAGL